MSRCHLCARGDPSVNVCCWDCKVTFHLHRQQLDHVPEGTVLMGDCPSCGVVNCWVKRGPGVDASGPVLYYGQPILDLREY